MTHNERERGKRLTIHNATKEQLKFMVQDRDNTIKRLCKELEDAKELIDALINLLPDDLEINA